MTRSRTRSPPSAMSGGSTNGVLHLLALAREIGHRSHDRRLRPDLRAHAPARRPEAGRTLRGQGPVRGGRRRRAGQAPRRGRGCCTATRSPSPAARSARRPTHAVEAEGQEVVRPLSDPLKATGGLVILHGNLAPEGCVVKVAGDERSHHTGPGAGLRAPRRSASPRSKAGGIEARRRRRDPQRGPGGRARHARDAPGDCGPGRRGDRRQGRPAHRRALLRGHARVDGRPRRP